MGLEAMKDTARRWIIGIWDNQDFQLLETLGAPGYVYQMPGKEGMTGPDLVEYITALRKAFPRLENTIEEQFAEGSVVVSRGTTRAINDGPFGDLPATGRSVELPWVIITRLEEGRVAEDWEIYDELSFLTQLGIKP
jgi:predicted ester cyclase